MLKSKIAISLIFFLLSLTLFAFSSLNGREKIKGKWFYNYGVNYYRTTDSGSTARWYEFKNNSKVSFSSCTDWCGCMRVTYLGDYDWINDSTISVVFTKSKRWGNKIATKLEGNRIETLQLSRVNKTLLKIKGITD